MSCSGCLKIISNEDKIKCSIGTCGKLFHIPCAAASHLTLDQVKKWICPECCVNAKKGGDNSNTPVRATENVTLRKKTYISPGFPLTKTNNDPSNSNPEGNNQALLAEIRLLRQDMAKLQSDFSSRFDDLSSKILDYDLRIRLLEDKEKENDLLKLQVSLLQEQLNKQSQDFLRSDLEVLGVSELPNENLYHLLLTTAFKIGVELDERDLDYVHRTGSRSKNDLENGKDRLPRPLVVSFTRRAKRDEFLRQAKSRNSLDSKDVVGSGPERKMYVNERLTNEKRQLFRTTRIWTKDNGYKYCWIRNGNIFIRRNDGRYGSPPIQIRSQQDLQKLSEEKKVDG